MEFLKQFWAANKSNVYAVVLALVLGLLGYNVMFGDASKFFDEHTAPTTASAPTTGGAP